MSSERIWPFENRFMKSHVFMELGQTELTRNVCRKMDANLSPEKKLGTKSRKTLWKTSHQTRKGRSEKKWTTFKIMKRRLVNAWVLSDVPVMPIRCGGTKPSSGYGPAQGSLRWSLQGTETYPAWFALVNSEVLSLCCIKHKQSIHLGCIFSCTSMLF